MNVSLRGEGDFVVEAEDAWRVEVSRGETWVLINERDFGGSPDGFVVYVNGEVVWPRPAGEPQWEETQ